MFKRRLLALAAGVTIGLPGMSMATLLQDNSENLPSSFAVQTTHSDSISDQLENTATIALTKNVDIFSRYKFPGISFENAASVGLSAARPAPTSRSLSQLIATASLGQGLYAPSDGSSNETQGGTTIARLSPPHRKTGPTLRDMAGALVNKPRSPAPRGGVPNDPRYRFSVIGTVLETQLDAAFIDAASDVVNPTIDPDGLITVNFLGLRDFALLVSPVTNKILVMDFKTGTTLTLSHSAYDDTASYEAKQRRRLSPRNSNSFEESKTVKLLIKFIKSLQYFGNNFLLHPVTLGAFLLLSICCGIFSISHRSR